MDECVFCAIARGEAPAKMLYQNHELSAVYSLYPAARVHALVIPNRHISSINEVNEEDAALLGSLVVTARNLAHQLGIAQSGYRLVFNTGQDARQTIFHIHLHLLGGERLFVRPHEENHVL